MDRGMWWATGMGSQRVGHELTLSLSYKISRMSNLLRKKVDYQMTPLFGQKVKKN